MRSLYNSYNYLTCPSFFSWIFRLEEIYGINNIENINGIFISTAHCIKFKDVVENSINTSIKYPKSIKDIINKEKNHHQLKTTLS